MARKHTIHNHATATDYHRAQAVYHHKEYQAAMERAEDAKQKFGEGSRQHELNKEWAKNHHDAYGHHHELAHAYGHRKLNHYFTEENN